MKRLLGVALVAVALAGCSSDEKAGDEVFLTQAREVMPGTPDENLLDIRKNTCEALDAKPDQAQLVAVLRVMQDKGLTPDNAGKLLAVSVATGCPKHASIGR